MSTYIGTVVENHCTTLGEELKKQKHQIDIRTTASAKEQTKIDESNAELIEMWTNVIAGNLLDTDEDIIAWMSLNQSRIEEILGQEIS